MRRHGSRPATFGLARAFALALVAATVAPSARAQDDSAGADSARRALGLARSIAVPFQVSAWRALDVDRDGADDLLVVGRGGEVRVWRGDAKTGRTADEPAGVLVLPEPERSVLAIEDVLNDGGPPQLVVLSRRGLEAYPVGPEGAFQRAPVLVSKAVSLAYRVGEPTFAPVLRDVNGDGRPDLLVPRAETCELWLWGPPVPGADGAPAVPQYRAAGAFKVAVSRERATESAELSDVLSSAFRVPALTLRDVNGDGRSDLAVEDGKVRSFHLARPDGTVSAEADVRVDLAKFEDTTPRADVQLGRTLAGGDEQRFETADLDGDGIPDYVIAHRRKVWVFLGTKDGPQFLEPSDVLKSADDVSTVLVARLDADPRPDLLLLRLQVPTVATLLRGLVASWDVEVTTAGFENAGGGRFERTPKWRGEIALRLPAILGILRDPEALIGRFEGLASKFDRGFVWGDFDGDGREDAAVASTTDRRLDVWFGVARERTGGAGGTGGAGTNGDRTNGASVADEMELGEVFFGTERVWDMDRVLRWLGDFADRRFAQVTGDREPSQRIELRAEKDAAFEGVGALRVGGATGIVVAYEGADGRGVFDVWR